MGYFPHCYLNRYFPLLPNLEPAYREICEISAIPVPDYSQFAVFESTPTFVRAVAYVRMSTDQQENSTLNQQELRTVKIDREWF
jgi:hypothetical protein